MKFHKMPSQLTKGYASFLFSTWGYASRKSLGTAVLQYWVFCDNKSLVLLLKNISEKREQLKLVILWDFLTATQLFTLRITFKKGL